VSTIKMESVEKRRQAPGATEMARRIMKRGGTSPRFSTG
jgi:hypothetical protein